MEISRRDFIKYSSGVVTGTFLPFSSTTGYAAPPDRITPKEKESIECAFTHVHNDRVSLVIDIIRHYERMVFRGFMVADGQSYDFCKFEDLFPFNREEHLYCENKATKELVYMNMEANRIRGEALNIRKTSDLSAKKVSFDLIYKIIEDPFRSSDFFKLGGGPFEEIRKLLDQFSVEAVSLLHEDFPLLRVKGSVKITDEQGNLLREFPLDGAKGAIAHHWGWNFPDYIFLMSNDFEGESPETSTLLTLNSSRAITRAATDIMAGYLYLKKPGQKAREFVCPLEGMTYHFVEDNKLSLIAHAKKEGGVRVDMKYKEAKAFPNFFNTTCTTIVDVPCEIIDMSSGKSLGKSTRAVLDVKGFNLP